MEHEHEPIEEYFHRAMGGDGDYRVVACTPVPSAAVVDYRALLKKYMAWVRDSGPPGRFTDAEEAELQRLAKET